MKRLAHLHITAAAGFGFMSAAMKAVKETKILESVKQANEFAFYSARKVVTGNRQKRTIRREI